MKMLLFLLYTLVALITNASLAKILFVSIQPGQWLDTLFKWQQRLQKWDMQGKRFLVKAGGYCELCFSHLVTFFCYWLYACFMNYVLKIWLPANEGIAILIVANIIWYIAYVSIGTNLSLYFITKLFRQ